MKGRGNLGLFGGLAVGLLVLDQLTKYWARHAAEFTEGRTIFPLWPGVFELKLIYNKGIAFGMLQGGGILLAPIAIIIAAAATYYSYRHPRQAKLVHVTMALLVSGAIGNLIDRLLMGKVTDMFWMAYPNTWYGPFDGFSIGWMPTGGFQVWHPMMGAIVYPDPFNQLQRNMWVRLYNTPFNVYVDGGLGSYVYAQYSPT